MRTRWVGQRRLSVVYETVSDETLVALARSEPAAFGALYDRHVRSVLSFLLRRTGDPEVAADLTAETFAAALGGLDGYEPSLGEPGAWLHGIAQYELLHWLRSRAVDQRARKRMAVPRWDVDDASIEAIDALDARSAVQQFGPALEQLSPMLRQALELRVLDDLSYEEVAQRAGCTVGAARVRVSRALAQLAVTAETANSLPNEHLSEDRPLVDRVTA